ncbi:MAG: hypothetical protein WC534_02205 [Candidatus Paceibacterota bacterium]
MEAKLNPDKIKKPFWIIGALLVIGCLVYVTITTSFNLFDSFQNFSNNIPSTSNSNSENYLPETKKSSGSETDNLNQLETEDKNFNNPTEEEEN